MKKARFYLTLPVTAMCVCMFSQTMWTARGTYGQQVNLATAQDLQQDLQDLDVNALWVYEDWQTARQEAAKSGKPIFALFR